MKQLKKLIAIVLSIAMVMCSTLPSLAVENDALQETTESKIVDQLKEDLGEERAVEILGGNVGVSTDGNFVEVSTASPEEDTSMGELCEPEEDEEESVNEYELSEPEEDETEAEKETDRLVSDDELESEELESDENGLTEETIDAETEEAISETEIIESSEVESNDDEVVVATDSEIQDTLLDLDEIVSLSSNEKLLGAGEPWMWWYLTDEGHTIHYTNSEPSVGGHGITTTGESTIKDQYSTLNIGDITKAVFDNEINAVTCVGLFMNFINLITVENINYLKTNNVTSFSSMFEHCSSLTNLDVSGFDTSSGKYFSGMFFDCSSLTSLDVSGFNTSRAITMFSMFEKCSSLTNLDVSGFDVSNVTYGGPLNGGLSGMFFGCSSLTGIDVSNFNTSNITNMRGMFRGCSSFTSIDVSNFNTNNVTTMNDMFCDCSSLTSIDISGFNTSNVTDMSSMFKGASQLQTITVSNNFVTTNVTTDSNMFLDCTSLVGGNGTVYSSSHIDKTYARIDTAGTPGYFTLAGGGNTPNTYLFTKDWALTCGISKTDITKIIFQKGGELPSGTEFSIGVSGLKGYTNGTEVTIFAPSANDEINAAADSSLMFSAYETGPFNSAPEMNLTSIVGLNNLDTSNVRSMNGMFLGCANISNLDLSSFDTSNVQDFGYMFYNCNGATSIDVSSFNTSNVINFGAMFQNCSSINSINISNFDYSSIDSTDHTDYSTFNLTFAENASTALMMGHMFDGCSSVTTINMGNVNASNCRNFASLFRNCANLLTISYSDFDVSEAISLNYMFFNCPSLTSIDLSKFNTSNVEYSQLLFGNCSNLQTINVSNDFATSQILYSNGMFSNCTSIVGGNGTTYDSTHINKEYARIDAVGTPGYFTLSGAPTLSGITVNTQPTKVKYKVGETFDPTGLKINLNYSDSSTTTVTYNSTTSSDFTFSPSTAFDTAGNSIPVTITYSGKNCIQNVVVIEPQSISIKTAPTKVKYAIGETFDPTGLSIEVTYSDGTTKETVTYAGNESNFTFNPSGALNTAGNSIPITITCTRNGNNFDCVQNVEVVELSTITINTAPSKTRYIKGTNFDPTGLKINLNYSDGTTNVVEYNSTTSSGFTFNGVATLTLTTNGNPFEITIGYAGKTTTQNVVVAELDSIEIATHATKLNYMSGDTFDPAGMAIRLTYSDSITETVAYNSITSSSFTFSPSNPLTRTGNVITVTYGGKSTTETLNVKELTGITIATNPTKLSYATGQSLNPAGLILTLTYNDSNNVNTTENVTYNSTTQSKFAFNPSGTAITTGNVIVTYDGKTGAGMQPTFAITVRTVASISVINRPNKTSYSSGNKLALSGLSIKVNYTNGTNETVAYSPNNANDFTFSPSTSTSLNTGHNSVTVSYGGKSTNFAISVTQSSGGYVPSNDGGLSGGSGGGGGGGGIPAGTNPLNNTPATTQVSQGKSISGVVNSDTSTWTSDPLSGKYKLNILDASGNQVPVSNGFYMVTNTVTQVVNNIPIQTQVNNTYYFDTQGNMVTGWVQTADNKWFFFENAKTADEGKMSLGWKQVLGSWYYFTADGSMMENGITPDGFIIGADGKWVG